MNYHVWRLFYYVAITGSMTKASERLHISQPAISAQIRKYEREHQIKLLEAKGKRMVLTPLGRRLIQPLEKLFTLGEQIEQMMEDERRFPAGTLRIAGHYLAATRFLPRWASLFKQRFPDIGIRISTVNSRAAWKQLVNFETDIAIYSDREMTNVQAEVETDKFERRLLMKDEYLFVAASDHPWANRQVRLEEVAKEPFIMREEGSAARAQLLQLCQEKQVESPRIELQFNGVNETIQAVIAGYGMTFVSSLLAQPYLEQGTLAKVDAGSTGNAHAIWLAARPQAELERHVQLFVKLVLEEVGGLV